MRRFRRTALSLLVWLTAATTLVGATPHFICRCPNGNVKPFCLGISFRTAVAASLTPKCCCNGDCCGASKGKVCRCGKGEPSNGKAASCCSGEDGQLSGPNLQRGSQVSGTCCTKRVVQPESVTTSYHKTSVPTDDADAQLLASDALQARVPISVEPHDADWQEHERPPPTDLVLTLRHLLI